MTMVRAEHTVNLVQQPYSDGAPDVPPYMPPVAALLVDVSVPLHWAPAVDGAGTADAELITAASPCAGSSGVTPSADVDPADVPEANDG